ncbi:MAG: tRNA 2-thiocytidine biosynthesis protein TtcA [Peptostreptococcaceae bacterium]|jgi:tRNA(Ile)-lysidine synthetase-like protein|nr:tRNA 2-thiocytidine biosynthesis protein TtcA [Peptostreptococcaceae bacterium]
MKKYLKNLIIKDILKAIDDFDMIQENDYIAVGISGGKDSMVLLYALNLIKKYSKYKFNIIGINIDYGNKMDFSEIKRFCKENEIDFYIEKTNIIEELNFEDKSTCYKCAKMRKGAMKRVCKLKNINKIAFGHHKDDVVQTFFLNLLQVGKLGAFSPNLKDKKDNISIIRPLIYVDEERVIKVKDIERIPIVESKCPLNKKTKREDMNNLIKEIQKKNTDVKDKIISSLKNIYEDGIWKV